MEFKEFSPEKLLSISYLTMIITNLRLMSLRVILYWKDSSVNDEIDKLRLLYDFSPSERNDVIVVASSLCIYGLGSLGNMLTVLLVSVQVLRFRDNFLGMTWSIFSLNAIYWFPTGKISVFVGMGGDFPSFQRWNAFRVEFSGMRLTVSVKLRLWQVRYWEKWIICDFPCHHFVTIDDHMEVAIAKIQAELEDS